MFWLQEQAVHLREEPVGGLGHHDRDQHGGNQERSGQPAQGRAAVSWTGGDAADQALAGGFGMQIGDALRLSSPEGSVGNMVGLLAV